jgi:hypothetical protein
MIFKNTNSGYPTLDKKNVYEFLTETTEEKALIDHELYFSVFFVFE